MGALKEIHNYNVLQNGDGLDALFECLTKDKGMTVRRTTDRPPEVGDFVEIEGDRPGIEKHLGECDQDWGQYLEHR